MKMVNTGCNVQYVEITAINMARRQNDEDDVRLSTLETDKQQSCDKN
jgi:hypothetical protein